MRVFFVVFPLVLAAACMPPAGISAENYNETLAPAAVEAAQGAITGTYVVKLVNGAAPAINIEGREPTITIGAQRIRFQSQCIYADWTYERDGEDISTKSDYEPGSAMCARALAPGEAAIQNSLDKASTIRRAGERLYLEGGGYRLEAHRLPDPAQRER